MKTKSFDMPTCVTLLSEKQLSRLEKIITKKYKKFKCLYRIIEQHIEMIDFISYEDTNEDRELTVHLAISEKNKIETLQEFIEEYMKKHISNEVMCECSSDKATGVITITLKLEE